jgi:hypothetical protein
MAQAQNTIHHSNIGPEYTSEYADFLEDMKLDIPPLPLTQNSLSDHQNQIHSNNEQ